MHRPKSHLSRIVWTQDSIIQIQCFPSLSNFSQKNLSLFHIKKHSHISSYNHPPPPPQLYFPTSADYAEGYYLPSLSSLTVMELSSLFLYGTNSSDNPADKDTLFHRVSSLPRLVHSILHSRVQRESWILSIDVNHCHPGTRCWTIGYWLPSLSAIQRSRDLLNLKTISVLFLVHF